MENVSPEKVNHNLAFAFYYAFKILPIVVAGMSIYLGYELFILGVTGKASLSVESTKISGQLLNAAPGLFFAVGGLVTIIMSVWKGVQIHFDKPSRSRTGTSIAYNTREEPPPSAI